MESLSPKLTKMGTGGVAVSLIAVVGRAAPPQRRQWAQASHHSGWTKIVLAKKGAPPRTIYMGPSKEPNVARLSEKCGSACTTCAPRFDGDTM